MSPPDGAWSDPFFERIAGAYELMAMDFTPKDMLLLMFASPETPIGGVGMTSITDIEQTTYARSFLLNIVNNVINRVILASNQDFTYRDEIYISNVLRKLGITDTTNFLREAAQIFNEDSRTYRLTNLYEQHDFLLKTLVKEAEIESKATSDMIAATETPVTPEADLLTSETLFSEIIDRLGTESIVNRVNAYYMSGGDTLISNPAGINIAAWQGVTNSLNLYDARRNLNITDVDLMHRHESSYETGDGLPPPVKESEVLGRAVGAAIINIAQQSLLAQMSRMSRSDVHVRVDLINALPTASAPTLERVRELYIQDRDVIHAQHLFESRLTSLDYSEETLIKNLADAVPDYVPADRILLSSESDEDGGAIAYGAESLPGILIGAADIRKTFSEILRERTHIEHIIDRSRVHDSDTLINLLTDRIYEAHATPVERRAEVALVFPESEEAEVLAPEGTPEALQRSRAETDAAITEISEVIRQNEEAKEALGRGAFDSADVADTAGARMDYLEPEVEEIDPDEKLKAELDAVDKRNKEAAQKLVERAQELRKELEDKKPVDDVDLRRTAQDALSILNDPGKLAELLQEDSSAARDEKMQPSELTLLLSDLSPEYRTFYERLLSDFSEANEDINIRMANLPDFNAEAAAIQKERTIIEMQHAESERIKEAELLTEQTIHTIDRTADSTKRSMRGVYEDRPASVRLLHREQIYTDMPLTDNQRPAATAVEKEQRQVTTTERVIESHEIETEINRVVHEAQTQSTQEISSMIDRALAAQLGTISGQVYSHVERRLDMERSRRGK
jgi:hypothetical protein